MRPRLFASLLFALGSHLFASSAQAQLSYSVRMETESKTWEVTCELENPGAGDFEFWLARWTAGAYHRADYARFISEFEAFGEGGEPLEVKRQGQTHFALGAAGHRKIRLRYASPSMSKDVYADGVIDVEANRIADDFAFLNSVSLLGFVPGRLEEPHSVRFELPEGWKIACVVEPDAQGTYRTPSFYRLEDTPFLFSPSLRTVELEAGGKPLSVSAHGLDEDSMDLLVEDCYRLVEACSELLGGLPYPHYEFLFGFLPHGGGSGLEHSFSTLILFNANAPLSAARGLTAHEFFHLFCAERIHVEALQKPDYTQTFQSGTIWVNESITEYMSRLLLLYAGMQSPEEFLASLSEPDPQLEAMRAAGMIQPGPVVSRAASDWKDMGALMSFAGSVYQHGARVMFALDMEMRRLSAGRTGLEELVEHLMQEYVAKDRGFPEDGMLEILNRVAGHDLSGFYADHIEGLKPLDLNASLGVIGYGLRGGELIELEKLSAAQASAREAFFSPAD